MRDPEILARIDLGFAVVSGKYLKHVFKSQRALLEYLIENSSTPFYICASAELHGVIQAAFVLSKLNLIAPPKIFSPRILSFNKPTGTFSEKDLTWSFEENTHYAFGGPRFLTFDDFLFAAASKSLLERPQEDVYKIMVDHSFWIPANWFYPVNLEALARLLAIIGDPRWYLSEDFGKKRYKKVYELVGLDYIKFKLALMDGSVYRNPVLYALASWGDLEVLHSVVTSDKEDLIKSLPYNRNIFINTFVKETEHLKKNPIKVMYRITLQFVAALCESWVNFLSKGSESCIDVVPFTYKNEYFINDYKKYMLPLVASPIGQ